MIQIDILLATFNGETFLREQWDSLLGQSYTNWRLIIRDDGSSDHSVEMIREFKRQNPEKILFDDEDCQSKGACGNFSCLLGKSTSDYIMLCDQDDVWRPDKVSKTIELMKSIEQKYGHDKPILIHTDLRIVDEQLQPIFSSLLKYQHLSPHSGSQMHRLLTQNIATGCTMMINRPLLKLATPIPKKAIMHDWWLALIAALFGKISFLDESTILYRQHHKNCVGAKRWGIGRMVFQIQHFEAACKAMLHTMEQAKAILELYRDQIPPAMHAMINAYADLPRMSKMNRIKTVFKYRFFRQGMLRTAGFLVCLTMLSRSRH
ncbi:MAG: glycosyltransferase family 2 protein [Desulfobulbus sp.]|jgi:glycosyltransferase involved in cell wall biosynthesis|uniref:glycosyltransferase family 2 protein n=1 Tax=Desulfobulbus sp. TaxID=895 RepID=UPI002842FE6C|nr:glycosyltransferase family 2 protein [Desulfobulbus sp.]MDR2548602.1 glycosyltransferase family 2 protein [Desulfobulbus sp.]